MMLSVLSQFVLYHTRSIKVLQKCQSLTDTLITVRSEVSQLPILFLFVLNRTCATVELSEALCNFVLQL